VYAVKIDAYGFNPAATYPFPTKQSAERFAEGERSRHPGVRVDVIESNTEE